MTHPILRGTTNVGVALVHDIMGLDETNLGFAKKLNSDGFYVKSVDLFGGKVAKDVQEGMALRSTVTTAQIHAALTQAHEELGAAMPAGSVIGSMGFCFGGGCALEGACHAPFDFCVDYYGTSWTLDALKDLKGPLLLILAQKDERVNAWAFSQLLPRAATEGKRVELHLYPAVVHPFHRPDWTQSPFGGQRSYDEAAANDAWSRAVAFIRAQAGPPRSQPSDRR